MGLVWDGIVDPDTLHPGHVTLRHELADAAKRYDWTRTTEILRAHPGLVNTARPGGASLFAPLHQAAHGGAPPEIVSELIRLGAWRTLENACGERPLDVAARRGHRHLIGALAPVLRRDVPTGILRKIQSAFHAVILGRAAHLIGERGLRLPELEPLLECEAQTVWFAIPGMYGGFSYELRRDGVEALLVSESWCRVVGGSGQRRAITSAGSRLVEEGFV